MPSFIEVTRLESYQKSEELSVDSTKKERRKKTSFTHFGYKFKIRISTRSKRHPIRYPLLCMQTQFYENVMSGMLSKIISKSAE